MKNWIVSFSDKMNNKLSRSVVIVEFCVRTLQSGEIIRDKIFLLSDSNSTRL